MATASETAWSARWSALVDAEYHHDFGLEGAYRQNADEWGYNLNDVEQNVDMNDGSTLTGRVFSNVGLVVWRPESGAEVLGWSDE